MDFDSPDVEKEFPGLYASETGGGGGVGGRSRKGNDDDEFAGETGEHGEKLSKKDLLLGRRKDKKDKKDRGYATLDGESSPEEDHEVKSPSKTKKSKAFKFASSKKRDKSRDKESHQRVDTNIARCLDVADGGDHSSSHPNNGMAANLSAIGVGSTLTSTATAHSTDPTNALQSPPYGTLHKKDKKDKKDKDKKDKDKPPKDKDKKDKKSKHSSIVGCAGGVASIVGGVGSIDSEILELGDAQPIFGVSLGLAVERSRCHDLVNLPLVVRDCIDYLQEFGLHSADIYKVDGGKVRLQVLKRAYNNRESLGTADWDVPTACGLLKLFFKELPEPMLTTDLSVRFEEAASLSLVQQQHAELQTLVGQMPSYNQTLLAWTLRHFDAVTKHERHNKTNAQSLAVLLSPTLQMSHRMLVCLLCHCSTLFETTELIKYVPPINASSPNLPETSDAIATELRKQDSLLNQIHAEMNAGYATKRREEQLWEVQRIITQLKRKLRSFEKKPTGSDASQLQQQQQQHQPQQQQQLQHQHHIDNGCDATTDLPTSIDSSSRHTASASASARSALNNSCSLSAPKPNAAAAGSDDDSLRTAANLSNLLSPDSTPRSNNTGTKCSPLATPDICAAADGAAAAAIGEHDATMLTAAAAARTMPTTTAASSPRPADIDGHHDNRLSVHGDSGLLLLPATHPDAALLLRLQLENQELTKWKAELQARINAARDDVLRLRTALRQMGADDDRAQLYGSSGSSRHHRQHQQQLQLQQQRILEGLSADELSGYERIVAHYAQENAVLEHRKQLLVREVFDENVELIQMQVDWSLKQFKY